MKTQLSEELLLVGLLKESHPHIVTMQYGKTGRWLRENLGAGNRVKFGYWTLFGNSNYARFRGRTYFANESDALMFKLIAK